MQDLVSWETQSGTPVQVGSRTITPQAQAFTLKFPYGSLFWNRPTGVLVEENGRVEHHPVTDVTRAALISFFAFAVIFNLLLFFLRIIRRSTS